MDISTLNVLIESLNSGINVENLLISEHKKDKKIVLIKSLCHKNKITYKIVPQSTIDKKTSKDNQGIYAQISPISFYSIEELISQPKKGIILILDKINDTGNLGAIIRTAVGADIDGIIISQRGSAPINETVLKASAGGLLKARIAQVVNLSSAIEKLKKNDYWIASTVMEGDTNYYDYDFNYKTAIVIGNEHNGVSDLLKKNSDYLLSIPHSSNIESLNVSVATSIVLFEALRQKAITNLQ